MLEAARKYAKPDIDAATAITNQLRFAKTSDDWDDLIYDITKEAVDAALGVTEDRMSYVAIEFQPGDRGEWESVESVHGPFDTPDEAYDALEPFNSLVYSARTSPYVVVISVKDPK